METLIAVAPFAIAGSILPTWTIVVIGLLGTARPVANALAFVAGNAVFRLALGVVLVLFATALPDSANLRLDSGGFSPVVPLAVGIGLLGLGALVWRRPPAAEGRTLIDRAERVHPAIAFVAGLAAVAAPGVQYAYFLGGVAAIAETVAGTAARLAGLAVLVLALQWMLVLPVVVYLGLRTRADRLLETMKGWLKANGPRLGGGILFAVGLYLTVFGASELLGG